MSWIDKVNTGMTITTGDNKRYTPAWMNASYQVDYHTTQFDYIGVDGSRVDRRKRMGIRYNIEIFFQGADHLDVSRNFRESCDKSTAPWIIEHPMYDLLIVQITSLNYDNTGGNVTKITGAVIETLENPPVDNLFEPRDQIPLLYQDTTEAAVNSVTETPTPQDINTMTQTNNTVFAKGVPIITKDDDFAIFYDTVNSAQADIDTATATPIQAMRGMIAAIQLPGLFEASVKQRMQVLVDTFNSLRANLFGLVAVSSKQIFCAQQSASITAMCNAASTPLKTDYQNTNAVLEIIQQLTGRYRQIVEDLDQIQTVNAGSLLSFVADADLMLNLNNLVNITVTNLFIIALSARSERSIICEKDTNAILLTHRLYGMDLNDQNLNDLIANNEFSLSELLSVEKGRKIIYYV